MKKTSNRVLFFGNERLATGIHSHVSVLQALLGAGYDVPAVVVAQNEAARSRRARRLEVAIIADQHGIPVLAPADLLEVRDQLKSLNAEAAVLVSYGKLIPAAALELFPHGIVNIHPSLLPLHRGAAPIENAILSGDSQTGVSLMRLSAKMDSGPLYAQKAVPLDGSETKQTLANQLTAIGVDMLLGCLPGILDGSLRPKPQDEAKATYNHHIDKADGLIDWRKPADRLEREVRAFLEWPKSRTTLGGKEVIITKTHAVPSNNPGAKPGDIETLKQGMIMVECGTGYLCIERLKPAGKPEMSAKAFLAGYRLG